MLPPVAVANDRKWRWRPASHGSAPQRDGSLVAGASGAASRESLRAASSITLSASSFDIAGAPVPPFSLVPQCVNAGQPNARDAAVSDRGAHQKAQRILPEGAHASKNARSTRAGRNAARDGGGLAGRHGRAL